MRVQELFTLAFTLQLIASAGAIASSWAYGNKSLKGPMIGLATQVPWWAIMIQSDLWGLIPTNVFMTIIHARNFHKWWKDNK